MRSVIGGGVLALALWLAAPALAAFPGANGLLAVQPVAGHGIVLVTADGRVVRRVCRDRKRCGTPRRARWSPDGQSLVFAGPRIRIVYANGSCLDCQFGAAPDPAFERGGTKISFIQRGRVTVDGIDTLRKGSPGVRGVSDAVWSATGELAVVRNGAVWVGRPGTLRRLAFGRQPTWSPAGGLIAAAQRGWVVVIGVRNHRVRRLARGSAPAFSPDGRWVAFVAPDHRLMVVAAGGGRPRTVGHVRALSVDWQPRPRGRVRSCVAAPGSTVVASTPAAVITRHGPPGLPTGRNPFLRIAYMGCLRADGRERVLGLITGNDYYVSTFVPSAVLAPPFAALLVRSDNLHDDVVTDTVEVFDLRTGEQREDLGGETASCPGSTCTTVQQVVLGSDGVSAAHLQQATGPLLTNPLGQDACAPASTVCVALDVRYNSVFSSTNPAAGPQSWALGQAFVGAPPTVLTCPSQSLCVGGGSAIYTSVNAAGGKATWTETSLPGNPAGIVGISCPTVSLCVAARDDGTIATSTNPAGGAQAWKITKIDATGLRAVVCSAAPRCFVADDVGTVLTSGNPDGGAGAWSASPTTPPFRSGTCPTITFCVTVDGHESATTTDPSAAVWTTRSVGDSLDNVSCPSTTLCVAVVTQGQLDIATDPVSANWTPTTEDSAESLVWVSCASTSLCVATGAAGDLVVSTNPTGGPSAWSPGLLFSDCAMNGPCNVESIEASDGAGLRTIDTDRSSTPQALLTGLSLSGDTLSWSHEGNPRTAQLRPPLTSH